MYDGRLQLLFTNTCSACRFRGGLSVRQRDSPVMRGYLLRDNQNPMLCVNQTCKSHWAVCYVGVHRSSRMLAAEIRVKPGLRLPPSVAIGLDADRGREPPLQSLLAGLIVAGSGSLIVAQQSVHDQEGSFNHPAWDCIFL
jgi:hypothetical protein